MASDLTTASTRLNAAINVLAYGADPTGANDCRAAFAAAAVEAKTRDFSTIYVPAGPYFFEEDDGDAPGWVLENIAGLCVRGDGALRAPGQLANFTGTILNFAVGADNIGLLITDCLGARFENLTILGASSGSDPRGIGARIRHNTGSGSSGIQFQNCAFRWCAVCVQAGPVEGMNDPLLDSELAFYDCLFEHSNVGFQTRHDQSLAHKFIGCNGGGSGSPIELMEVMFDLQDGGNVTVVGFGGGSMECFVKAGNGGGNIGWNLFQNVRLEARSSSTPAPRMRIYQNTTGGGKQRFEFNGLTIPTQAGGEVDDGTPRFELRANDDVVLWNGSQAAASQPLATPTSPLVEFVDGGLFRAYNTTVPFNARLDRSNVPTGAMYSFIDCQEDDQTPYPDLRNPPLYGPNDLMSVESHCFAVGDGLNGVIAYVSGGSNTVASTPPDASRAGIIRCNTLSSGYASLLSDANTVILGSGGQWHFKASVRVYNPSDGTDTFAVRLGFGNQVGSEPTNGVYFKYTSTGSTPNWQAIATKTGSGTSPDVVTTSVQAYPSAAVWRTFEIVINADSSEAAFYIDGELVATLDGSEIPTSGGQNIRLMPIQVERTAGSSNRAADIDYFKYEFRPTSPSAMYPQ
ncbi:MAG: hypothetical protein H6809_07350 [Phycisphaeraceae bacterium]|nr:hypothetical protein [Phycisphaeraceae bacterium]